ncbi:MAG TPA: c-type cytochrome [Rhodopila sp.]|jgi:cytochrome c
MRWRHKAAIWLAASVGFVFGLLTASSALMPAGTRPSAQVAAAGSRWTWYLGVACAVLVVACAGVAGWQFSEASQRTEVARSLTGGDPARAPVLMIRYGCGGCHTIPGVPGADGQVGPNLSGLRARVFVGGVARNDAANLIHWIVNPRDLSPRTAMPSTGISPAEARDVAAFLYTR